MDITLNQQAERCPTCGKVKSWTWWNPNAAAAATSLVASSLPLTTDTQPLTTLLPYAPAAAAASTRSIDICWCGISAR